MSEYVITINSTSDLPKEWVWEREIPVVPLNCTIGGKTYRDMYDLTAEEFYGMLENGEMAVTSQPSPQTAIDILEPILKKGKDILHLSFTSGLSGTYNSMCIAAEELREKYNVATAVSGKIALNFLEKRKTDLILLDYVMPDEDGPAVLKKLRENDATKDIPVVFLTGINDRSKIEKVLDMKPQGYLLKPIKPEKLFRTIRQIIG